MKKSLMRRAIGAVAMTAAAAFLLTSCSSSAPQNEPAPSAPSDEDSAFDQALFDLLPDDIQASKVIKVANPYNVPWVRLEADGKTLTGPAPELATALEPILGVTFEWIESPFPNLIPGLQANRFDLAWGSMGDTIERQELLDFVDYTREFSQLFVQKANPKGIETIEDLCGNSVATVTGSRQLQILEEASAECGAAGEMTISTYAGAPEGILALRSEKFDAFLGTFGSAVQALQDGGLDNELAAVGPYYAESVNGIGMLKGRDGLAEALQSALKKVVADGDYAKILAKYSFDSYALTEDKITINGSVV